MKVMTVWQPWATLIETGVKRFETRTRSTKIRGRIGVHAALTMRRIAQKAPDGWVYVWEPKSAGHEYLIRRSPETALGLQSAPLPTGVIVATVELTGSIPIIQADQLDATELERYGTEHIWCSTRNPTVSCHADGCETDISDQYPYGDWTGGYAWQLQEPVSTPRIPHTGLQGWSTRGLEQLDRPDGA
jgi:ASCH domain